MNRREFCAGLGSAVAASVGAASIGQETQVAPKDVDTDPVGGYCLMPPKQFLFTDLRHIDPCDVQWRSADGKALPVAGPPGPPVTAIADPGFVPYGIRLVSKPARKEGPIADLPWRILHDAGLYRSWRFDANYPKGKDLGSYSTALPESLTVKCGQSNDGYVWSWRDVQQIPLSGVTGIDGDFVFIDPHSPSSERYKCIYNAWIRSDPSRYWESYRRLHPRHRDLRLRSDYIYGLFGMVSPDGLNWKPIAEPLMIHKGDTDNTVYWDEWLGKYVLYTRLYWMQRRMVARAESHDFRRWTPVEPVLRPGLDDPFSMDVYTNARTNYPSRPDCHLMFPMFYHRRTQTSEVHLHSSLDGIHWDRVPGGPVIAPGNPGEWDGEYIAAGRDLVTLGKDRLAIPYSGCSHPHKYPRWPGVITHGTGWASWSRDRMCALVADDEGQCCTFPIQVTGRELRVNVQVRRAGELRIGLLGVDGRSATDCDPIIGNESLRTVTWKGNSRIPLEPGSTVRISFRLRAAELYAFEWV